MIQLYTFKTPNGRKVSIALEEMGLPYQAHSIDISKGEQFAPDFLAISPNNKIPAIVDPDGPGGAPLSLFESGAILIYLAEKTGRFLPPSQRPQVLQWLMFQMGGVGPMFGQFNHFTVFATEKIPYAMERYTKESARLLGVMEKQLSAHEYIAGEYSIADMALYPWVAGTIERLREHGEFPQVRRWLARVGERPAVQQGMKVPA